MISPPPAEEVAVAPVKQKTKVAKKEIPVVETLSDEKGIFDDAEHQLKVDLSKWKLISDELGVQTYEKVSSNSGLVAFRGETLISAPLKKIATILNTDSFQKDWVDSFVESKILSKKDELERIEYNQTSVPWPFQNRDFVFKSVSKLNVRPPTALITMQSLTDPAMPPRVGIVRGEMIHSYYYLKEIPGINATKMVVEMEVNPKGEIPMWLVNLSQKGWPQNTLLALKKLSIREDISVLPSIENFFEVKKQLVVKKKQKQKGKTI